MQELHRDDPEPLRPEHVDEGAPERLDHPGEVEPGGVEGDVGIGDAETLVEDHRYRHGHDVGGAFGEIEGRDPCPGIPHRWFFLPHRPLPQYRFTQRRAAEVAPEDLLRGEPLLRHDGGPDLAEADAVPPARPVEGKAGRSPGGLPGRADDEGAAVEMARREPAADLQLLPDGHRGLRSLDPKQADPPGGTAFERYEAAQDAEVDPRFRPQYRLQFLPSVAHLPAEEVGRLPVEGGKDPPQERQIVRAAGDVGTGEDPALRIRLGPDRGMGRCGVGNVGEVGNRDLLPAGCEVLGQAAAGLVVAGVADLHPPWIRKTPRVSRTASAALPATLPVIP